MSTITQFPSGNTQYRIEFDYLARTFIVVTLVNSSNPTLNRVLEVGRDYRFLNPTMIEMLVDQSGFDIVRIHRQTGTDLVVDFRNGSVLTASDLTNAELQAIHIAEEGRDQTVDLAKEYADAAGSSAGNAKDSEDEARRIAETVKAGLLGYITRRSFEKGFTVTTWSEVLLWEQDGEYYRWDGGLPKTVPVGSTPETSGGVGLGAWVSVGDASLRHDLAAPGGLALVGPGVMSRGLDKFSIMQGRPGEYLGPDVTHGLGMKLVEPLTGLVDQSNGGKLNFIHIVDDRLDAVSDTFPGTKVDGLQILHSFGGPGCKGGRHAAQFVSSQSAPTESTNTDRNYVGVVGWATTFSGDGGDGSGDDLGAFFGGNFITTLPAGALHTLNATGAEFNISVAEGASTRIRTGLQVGGGGSQQGTVIDAALSVGNKRGAVPWRNGLRIGTHHGGEALGPGSKAIVAVSSGPIQAGIDLPPTSLYVLTSGNMKIYDYGASFETTNAHLDLGAPASPSTTYIDFHTSGRNATYDSRIIASAGTETTGAGTWQIMTGVLGLNATTEIQFSATFRPTTDNTYDVGTPSRRGRTAYFGTGTINTSDERNKPIRDNISDALLDAWGDVSWSTMFKFDEAIAEKGADGARWHFGLIAQRVRDVLKEHGIDGFTLGLLCYDEWEDQYIKVRTNEGATITKTRTVQVGVEVKKVRTIKRPVMVTATRDVLVDDIQPDGTRVKRVVSEEYETQLTEQIPVLMADGSLNPHQPYVTEVVTEEVEEEYVEMELVDTIEEYTEPAEPEYTDVLDIAAGSRYGIRYEEALALEAALQRRNYERMKDQYENLVARVETLESK